jgi:uncharacterized protein YfiM (DUF2279 family)
MRNFFSAIASVGFLAFPLSLHSQADSISVEIVRAAALDTITATGMEYPPKKKRRIITVSALHACLYAGSLVVLNEAWYKDFPKTGFQTFDDSKEWLQVDKVGHAWTAYQLGRASMASWKWAGLKPKQQVWLGGMSGFAFLTVIEWLDAHSAEWGWSWADMAANAAGSGLFVGQQLGWKDQRIAFKFGFHTMNYADPILQKRTEELFGTSWPERMLKDYNGQTYWLSANLKSFLPRANLPDWLNLAVGYGATGMFGGFSNSWTDPQTGVEYDRTDVPRRRQWYLAPDVDFTRIKTKSKLLKSVFYCLNAFKMPAPTLLFSNGKWVVHGFYF